LSHDSQMLQQRRVESNKNKLACLYIIPPPLSLLHPLSVTTTAMAPKPASTAGKAPASTATKAPAKTTTAEGGKKRPPADGEKKKRKKVRKETYSSYIYKGSFVLFSLSLFVDIFGFSPQAGPSRYWYLQQGDGYPQ
jgi:hypothetical protein